METLYRLRYALIVGVGAVGYKSSRVRLILTREVERCEEETVLKLPVGPGANLVVDYVRWVLLVVILFVMLDYVMKAVHDYANATEKVINDRRTGKAGTVDEANVFIPGKTTRPLFLVDLFMVKVLLVFFPGVQVRRLSMHEAAQAVTSREGNLRRQTSETTRSGLQLLSFHRSIQETRAPMTITMIWVFNAVIVFSTATLFTIKMDEATTRYVGQLLHAVVSLRILVPLSSAISVILEDWVERSGSTRLLRNSWTVVANVIQMTFWLITFATVLSSLGFDMTSYLAGFGISSIAAAFAAQRTLAEMFSTASLLADQPFVVGDLVFFNGRQARVVRIGFRSTHFLTIYNGEIMVVPNAELATKVIFNKTAMKTRRVKTAIHVSFTTEISNVKTVTDLIEKAVTSAPNAHFIYTHLMELTLDGARFEYVYEVDGHESKPYKDAQHHINLTIMELFRDNHITLSTRPNMKK